MKRLLFGILVLIAGPRPASGDEFVPIVFEENYEGFHRKEFNALLERVKGVVPNALQHVCTRWGMPVGLRHPLKVSIVDLPSKSLARPLAAYVRATGYGNGLQQWLVVDLERHTRHPDDNLDPVLYHEMAHAVLRDATTGVGKVKIPSWFNEGLAQSVTGEGSWRAKSDFQRYGHSDARRVLCSLSGPADEFSHGEHGFGCYTQYYLAVKRLLQLGGPDSLPKIFAALREERPLPEIIHELTNLDQKAFERDVEGYTLEVFAGNQPIP